MRELEATNVVFLRLTKSLSGTEDLRFPLGLLVARLIGRRRKPVGFMQAAPQMYIDG